MAVPASTKRRMSLSLCFLITGAQEMRDGTLFIHCLAPFKGGCPGMTGVILAGERELDRGWDVRNCGEMLGF